MSTGTAKLFHSSKGYAFIRQDSGGKDVFVHISTIQTAGLRALRKGQKVSFEIFDNRESRQQRTGVIAVLIEKCRSRN